MTIQQLYEWAIKKGIQNYNVEVERMDGFDSAVVEDVEICDIAIEEDFRRIIF